MTATVVLAALVVTLALAFVVVTVFWHKASADRLRSEFAALAAEKLEEKANDLSAKNARDVKPLFDSLRQNIDDFKKAAASTMDANIRLGGELTAKLDEVGRNAASLGRQAEDFMAALKGGNKIQGNWGEGIVRNVLERAGLKSPDDFKEQEGAHKAGVPDFIVSDGTHRKVVIDSKVNIEAFLAGVQAADEGRHDVAAAKMKEHAKSVRMQIAGLAGKRYPQKLKENDADTEYAPVVIMAMPSEATYAAALTADPDIGTFANSQGVALASPQMLFGYLTLFKLGLDRLKVDRNNQDIAKRAEQILSRMDQAYVALEKIGRALDDAQRQYHEAMRKLGGEEGAQSILVPARALAKLANTSEKRSSSALQG